jgi:hypothetical protein
MAKVSMNTGADEAGKGYTLESGDGAGAGLANVASDKITEVVLFASTFAFSAMLDAATESAVLAIQSSLTFPESQHPLTKRSPYIQKLGCSATAGGPTYAAKSVLTTALIAAVVGV